MSIVKLKRKLSKLETVMLWLIVQLAAKELVGFQGPLDAGTAEEHYATIVDTRLSRQTDAQLAVKLIPDDEEKQWQERASRA